MAENNAIIEVGGSCLYVCLHMQSTAHTPEGAAELHMVKRALGDSAPTHYCYHLSCL